MRVVTLIVPARQGSTRDQPGINLGSERWGQALSDRPAAANPCSRLLGTGSSFRKDVFFQRPHTFVEASGLYS